jgi:hypothetical protein
MNTRTICGVHLPGAGDAVRRGATAVFDDPRMMSA